MTRLGVIVLLAGAVACRFSGPQLLPSPEPRPTEPSVEEFGGARFEPPPQSEVGPDLKRKALPLPRSHSGVLVDTGDAVVIVDGEGLVTGQLRNLYIDELSEQSSGPILVRDQTTPMASFVYYGGIYNLVPFPDPSLALVHGVALVEQFLEGRSNMVLKAGKVHWNFGVGRCCIQIATGREIVAAIDPSGVHQAYDIVGRQKMSLPKGCLPLGRGDFGTYLSCEEVDEARVDVLSISGSIRNLAGPATEQGSWIHLDPFAQGISDPWRLDRALRIRRLSHLAAEWRVEATPERRESRRIRISSNRLESRL